MTIFISYTTPDRNFVPLLEELLKLHWLEPWSSLSDIDGGEKFAKEIEDAIEQADAMIVVISNESTESKWMTREIAEFRKQKPDAPIIPIMLEKVPLVRIMPGLEDYQAIDFSRCQLEGFRRLLAALGSGFLDPRELSDRRRGAERRDSGERRKTSPATRLLFGLFLCLVRNKGETAVDGRIGCEDLGELNSFLIDEVRKYKYSRVTTGMMVGPEEVLSISLKKVRNELANAPVDLMIGLRILRDAIVEEFAVTILDRRRSVIYRSGHRTKVESRRKSRVYFTST